LSAAANGRPRNVIHQHLEPPAGFAALGGNEDRGIVKVAPAEVEPGGAGGEAAVEARRILGGPVRSELMQQVGPRVDGIGPGIGRGAGVGAVNITANRDVRRDLAIIGKRAVPACLSLADQVIARAGTVRLTPRAARAGEGQTAPVEQETGANE
jgi:hypothetical protein